MQVILDTNFLMLAHQFRIDIFKQLETILPGCEFVISSKVLNELRKISESSKKSKFAARFALKLVERSSIRVERSRREVDGWIFDYAVKNRAIVCTNDSELKERLKKSGVKVVGLRGKTKIDFL